MTGGLPCCAGGALDFYTAKNMGWDYTPEQEAEWQMNERGGGQGDYRDGMQAKIANAIDCLRTHPNSKRATIPIAFANEGTSTVNWTDAAQTKCCRELYLYIEGGKLCCTAVLRMQNASIFPKNIHFFATLLHHVAAELDVEVAGAASVTCTVAKRSTPPTQFLPYHDSRITDVTPFRFSR